MYAAQKPHVPEIESPDPSKTPRTPNTATTAPPSYRGVSGVPTVDGEGLGLHNGNSELPGSPAFPPPGHGGGGAGGLAEGPSELEGSTYQAYRPQAGAYQAYRPPARS